MQLEWETVKLPRIVCNQENVLVLTFRVQLEWEVLKFPSCRTIHNQENVHVLILRQLVGIHKEDLWAQLEWEKVKLPRMVCNQENMLMVRQAVALRV